MRRRNKHRKHRLQNWLHWLKRLWRSLVKSLKVFFTADLDKDKHLQPPRSAVAEKSNSRSESLIDSSRPATFLLGLEDIENLELLTTKELIEQIAWNADSQEIVMAKEEDLNLLEDLLVNFPES